MINYKVFSKKLKKLKIENIEILKEENSYKSVILEILLSLKEQKLYSLMQLCSTNIVKQWDKKSFISLELFEYCRKNFQRRK